jgi:hypothetical protein
MADKKPYVQKPNTGSLFINDRKEKDSHPDYSGTLNVEGKEYWLSMWDNGENGKPRFGVGVKLKEARRGDVPARDSSPKANPAPAAGPKDEDTVPF